MLINMTTETAIQKNFISLILVLDVEGGGKKCLYCSLFKTARLTTRTRLPVSQ